LHPLESAVFARRTPKVGVLGIAHQGFEGHIWSMSELKFRSSIQPSSTSGSWKWELYVEGEEAPIAVGFAVGSEADADAAILKAKQFALDNLGDLPSAGPEAMNGQAERRCSFCEKLQSEVTLMIVGFTGIICDECVKLCVEEVIAKKEPDWLKKVASRLPSD
jgi:hypothetical protein